MIKKLILGLTAASLISCATVGSDRPSTPPTGNAGRLIARPDAEAAKKAAPEWCRDALKTINSLEYENQTLKHQIEK